MQREKPFRRQHLEALLPSFEQKPWRVDDFGVWPEVDFEDCERLGLSFEYRVLSWKPVFVFKDDQPAPDCKNAPALPFPFDAGDLAAFMLNGVGSFVAEFYGEWEDGPDESALDAIDPGDNYARQAVRSAFHAYREAKKAIGCPKDDYPDTEAMVRELLGPKGLLGNSAQAAPESSFKEAEFACDFSALATPVQLIGAFGSFTGMDASWFNNVKDTPALLAARKEVGQGGNGHVRVPRFCPFEVMQWLTDSKRRKGRPLGTDKAWEILEKNFPRAYGVRSVADPRSGD